MKALALFNDLLGKVAEVGRAMIAPDSVNMSIEDQCAVLLAGRGEATELGLARAILDRFAKLDLKGKQAFFAAVLFQFGVDRAALKRALADLERSDDEDAARNIHFASEPRSQELIRRLNRTPNGTRDLVAMRNDLLQAIKLDPRLAPLDADFRHLLGSWFNRGFLELRRIDWSTSAAILEKVLEYEAVHEIDGWDDLRSRVAAPDRLLFAFFHPALRDDPLIFVEVALATDIPAAITPILAKPRRPIDPSLSRVAVFYSISNCQEGLRGISFGNFLIKQVVEELRQQYEGLDTFVTLSPVPGLRRWLSSDLALGRDGLLTEAERAALSDGAKASPPPADLCVAVAAKYLLLARNAAGQPIDPVARFHLGNGAMLDRINVGADPGARAQGDSWGMMVNYRYDLAAIERNHEAYANNSVVAASAQVKRLLPRR